MQESFSAREDIGAAGDGKAQSLFPEYREVPFREIRKRDGRLVPFELEKITAAIFKAARAVGGTNREIAENLAGQVLKELLKTGYNGAVPAVEEVQDAVEKVLIESGHARTAKAYILYRDRRTRIREGKTELMDAVKEILVETSRENANVSNSPSAKMLQIAMAASKKYYLSNLIPDEFARAHQEGSFHIHDLDYYSKTLNCLQIDLGKLLREGFNTGYGYLRPPKRVSSAAAQAAIILQSNQNDMFGGQSFPHFDYDMAALIRDLPGGAAEGEIFQAMEGLIYNLNSMHSLSGKERIWVYDKLDGMMSAVTMADFHERYEDNRYQALSVNYRTGATELQNITASCRHVNVHKIYTVKLKSGQKVTVTGNHSVITVNENGSITTAIPANLARALVPRELNLEREPASYDLTRYPVSRKYPLEKLRLTPALAKLMGYYVAEGSVDGSTVYLALFNKTLEQEARDILRQIHPRFTTRPRLKNGRPGDLACNVGRTFAAFLKDKCGQGAARKKVPSELFFADTVTVKAFLDGYLSGDGTVGSNRITAASISRELRDGLQLLYCKLGLPVSFALIKSEQTPYDYDYLRPLIKEVYGIYCGNAYNYRIKPAYLEEIPADLSGRILTDQEKDTLRKMSQENFWLDQLREVLPRINTTQRHHLRRLVRSGKLPRFSKYLPQFFPYADMLKRFFLPERVSAETLNCIKNDCRSPVMVMAWAEKILDQNERMVRLRDTIQRSLRVWPIKVKKLIEEEAEEYVYDISVSGNENFLTAEGIFVHNSRAGAQVPFTSINLGTDASAEGRTVTEAVLEAFQRGLGRGESPIFPNLVFRVKEGVNLSPGDPNHDLFQKAVRVAARRMNPTFSFMDCTMNRPYGEEVSYMGCRSRVIGNRHGPEVSAGRGNIAPVTLNLPRLALESRGKLDLFLADLDRLMRLGARQLLHRFEVLSRLRARDLPFLMGEKLYLGSGTLGPEDSVGEVIKNGTLAVGFIGLAEALHALIGKHHGEDGEAQDLGLRIVDQMRRRTDQFAEEYDLNFVLYATPAEGLAGRFVAMDRERYGRIPGVTDREYYTNSFHLPVGFATSAFDKISIEGQFHSYLNAGHISYVELEAPPVHNPGALEKMIRHMAASNVGYGGVNFPIDECRSCAHGGVMDGACPRCGSTAIRRIRRITGYLSTADRFNEAKAAELCDRRPHFIPRSGR